MATESNVGHAGMIRNIGKGHRETRDQADGRHFLELVGRRGLVLVWGCWTCCCPKCGGRVGTRAGGEEVYESFEKGNED